jgi:hypothetical protein
VRGSASRLTGFPDSQHPYPIETLLSDPLNLFLMEFIQGGKTIGLFEIEFNHTWYSPDKVKDSLEGS